MASRTYDADRRIGNLEPKVCSGVKLRDQWIRYGELSDSTTDIHRMVKPHSEACIGVLVVVVTSFTHTFMHQ